MLDGIDISHYQQTTPDLTGLSFVICRATYDVLPDDMWPTHSAAVRKAGLPLGAYHFGTGRSPVAEQVDAFLSVAPDADFWALDLEADAVPMSVAWATTFITLFKRTGRRIGLYHSESGYTAIGQDWRWIADWAANPPPAPFAFWQKGSNRGVDGDLFNGDAAALQAFLGGQMVLPANTKFPALSRVDIPAGTQVYDLSAKPLTKPDATITVTSISQSTVYDLVILTTGGVTQHALVKSADLRNRTPWPDPELTAAQAKIAAAKAALM